MSSFNWIWRQVHAETVTHHTCLVYVYKLLASQKKGKEGKPIYVFRPFDLVYPTSRKNVGHWVHKLGGRSKIQHLYFITVFCHH